MNEMIYLYDGSFEGLLCCIFDSYANKEILTAIFSDEDFAPTLFPTRTVSTDAGHASRVLRKIHKLSPYAEELLRRGYEVTVGRTGDKEIDFVCDKRGEKLYVQVTYLLASEETVNREFGAYDSIRDNFPKYVVSLDEFDMSRNGIKHRNIRDFLLAEEWN